MANTTYTLRTGDVVTSKDGEWPTQYTNRTQAERAAAKVGGEVIQRGRPFYVRVCNRVVLSQPEPRAQQEHTCWCGCGSLQHHQEAVED